jgi:hypothetical protein
LRQEKFEEAKNLLTPVARNAKDASLQMRAQSLLDVLQRMAEQRERYKAETEAYNKRQPPQATSETTGPGATERPSLRRSTTEATTTEEPATPPPPTPWLRQYTEGEEVRGLLTKMECSDKGVTLYVTAGTQKYIFHTNEPQRLEFTTYTTNVGESIKCQEFNPGRHVRIVYRKSSDARFQGEPIAVDFIKPEN